MLLRIPDFYDSFHCIANKCTDTCCVGWEIDIDKTSLKRYATVEGEFGDRLRQDIEDGHFKLLEGDRCPFLRQDGLCDMICHLGESSLCDICREHPRFVEVYGDIMEKGIGLCCEEAVRLLLTAHETTQSPIAFIEREIKDTPDNIPDDAREARDIIFEERDQLFKIIADRSRPLNERLIEMLDFAVETSGIEIDEPDETLIEKTKVITQLHKNSNSTDNILNIILRSWIKILGKGESFGPAWDSAYKELSQIDHASCTHDASSTGQGVGLFSENDGAKIIAYLLYRYYAKSLFDGNSLTKVEFAIFFWIMLEKFGDTFASATGSTPNSKIAAVKLLSKQTEYSEEIMSILEQEFMENPLFSPQNFKILLKEKK